MNEISVLIKETQEVSFTPSAIWGYSKDYNLGNRHLLVTGSSDTLILNFSASRKNHEKYTVVYKLLSS
jgi:hypothetical protein